MTDRVVGSSAWFGEVFIRELEIYAAEGLVVCMVWNRFEAIPQVRNGSESSDIRRLRPVASTLSVCIWFESPTSISRSLRCGLDIRPPVRNLPMCRTFKMSRDRGWRASCGSEHEA